MAYEPTQVDEIVARAMAGKRVAQEELGNVPVVPRGYHRKQVDRFFSSLFPSSH